MEKVTIDRYRVEIPCKDRDAALKLADHLRAFEPVVVNRPLIKEGDEFTFGEPVEIDTRQASLF